MNKNRFLLGKTLFSPTENAVFGKGNYFDVISCIGAALRHDSLPCRPFVADGWGCRNNFGQKLAEFLMVRQNRPIFASSKVTNETINIQYKL